MTRVSKICIHDDIVDISHVMHENVLVYKHTDIQTHENAHTYEHTSGTREWQSTGSATVLKANHRIRRGGREVEEAIHTQALLHHLG